MSLEVIKYGDMIDAFDDGSEKSVLQIGINVSNQAKANAPIDTGQLKSSIGYKAQTDQTAAPGLSTTINENEVAVGSAVEHATYQEFGTRKMAAQPFLRPAIDVYARGKSAESVIKFYQQKSVTESIMRGKTIAIFK